MVDLFRIAKAYEVALTIEYDYNYDRFEIHFENEQIKGAVGIERCFFLEYSKNEVVTSRILDELTNLIKKAKRNKE